MINVQTGEIILGRSGFAIHPKLSFSTFSRSGIVFRHIVVSIDGNGWDTADFTEQIDGIVVDFLICFGEGRPRLLGWNPVSEINGRGWSDISPEAQEDQLNNWLLGRLGKPPYSFEWGVIAVDRDIKSGNFGIVVRFPDYLP